MCAEEVFVDEFHARSLDFTLYHLFRMTEIIVLVRVARSAVGIYQSSLTATSGTSCPLGVVGWSGWHIAHAYNRKVFDVYAKFHSR